MNKLNLDNTIAITSCEDIRKSFEVMQKIGLTYFTYTKLFADGTRIYLSTNRDWILALHQKYFHLSISASSYDSYVTKFVLWNYSLSNEFLTVLNNEFNIGHGLTYYNKQLQSCEICHLGTTPDKGPIMNEIINNLEFIKRFLEYFKNQVSSIITAAHEDRMILPRCKISRSAEEDFLRKNSYNIDSKLLEICSQEVNLTPREIVILYHLQYGKTYKEVGKILAISPRTVESHINNIKTKLKVHNKSAIFRKLSEHNKFPLIFNC